ncbi:MFS transporter [Maribellus sp. CM-23]|nr:MFS transporter [Maribellus sp. CM-23]
MSDSKSKLPKGAWRILVLLFIVGALNYLDRTTITTMRFSIVESIPMTDAQFGLLSSVFLWVYGLLSPFAGFLADRFSRSKVIIFSLFVWSLVTWLTGYARTYEELLATRALMGISEACYIPAALSLIVDYHRDSTRSLATGIHMTGVMVGQSLGFIGGWIAEVHSWNFVFIIFGVIGISYSVILLFFLKDAPDQDGKDDAIKMNKSDVRIWNAFKYLFAQRSFILLLVFLGIAGFVTWIVVAWLPTYYKEFFNLSQTKAGFYATAYLYPASIVGLLLGGFWTDCWSSKNKYARFLVPAIGLCIAAPCIFIGSYTTVFALTIVFFMGYGLTKMFVDSNLMPMLCLIIDSRYRATGYGILNMFATIVGGIGIYLAGALRDSQINLRVVYQFASLSLIVCVVLLWMMKRNLSAKEKNAL